MSAFVGARTLKWSVPLTRMKVHHSSSWLPAPSRRAIRRCFARPCPRITNVGRVNLIQPAARRSQLELSRIGTCRTGGTRTGSSLTSLTGPNEKTARKRSRAFGDQEHERAAGAVPAQVDSLGIDRRLTGQEVSRGQDVVHLAEESFLGSRVLIAAAQRRKHHDDPGLAEARSRSGRCSARLRLQTSPIELQSPPVIQMIAGCFLPSSGAWLEVGRQLADG